MGIAMVPSERDFAINAKVSSAAADRLKKLSVRRGQSYGEVLNALLLEVPIEQAEWEQPLNDVLSRIAALETQISALLSGSATIADTESLPAVAAVVKLDTVESVHQEAHQDQDKQPVAFADLTDSEKHYWRGVMLDWQQKGIKNPQIGRQLWNEQRIGQYHFGRLEAMDRNRVKVEIDRVKGE